jgi:aminoglycoside 6'-N-acetyltransferase
LFVIRHSYFGTCSGSRGRDCSARWVRGTVKEVHLDSFDRGRHPECLRGWLLRPHVSRWWGDPRQAIEHAMQCSPDAHAVIVVDGTPVGYLCWQTPKPGELAEAGLTDLPEGLVDIDILIGRPEMLGQGVGTHALKLLLTRLHEESSFSLAGLGTSVSNVRAIRAFEKAGFRLFREFQDPEWGPCRYMVADV